MYEMRVKHENTFTRTASIHYTVNEIRRPPENMFNLFWSLINFFGDKKKFLAEIELEEVNLIPHFLRP